MFSKESQYINVIKYDTQLKVDYKKLKDDKMLFGEETTFIIHDEMLTKDISTKLNFWQNAIPKTYISTLCLCDDEKIIKKTNKRLNEHSKASLNNRYDVVVNKSKLFEVEHYFEHTGLDYVFSPFQILNLHIEQNPTANTLLVLTINSHVYLIIVNDKSQIVFNHVTKLTDFNSVKESHFYESEVIGQKLYDEMYALELQTSINEVIAKYYAQDKNTFIEKVDILYSLKQLNDEQIQVLEEELLINIHYHHISIKESLYELTRSNKSSLQSYIKPRLKKSSSFVKIMGFLTLFILAVSIGLIVFEKEVHDFVAQTKTAMETKREVIVKKANQPLPNHIEKNREIEKHVRSLMNVIPYDMVLDTLELKRNESTIYGRLLKPDTFIKDIRPELLKLYKYANIQIKDSKDVSLEAMIYSNDLLKEVNPKKIILPKYFNDGFLPQSQVTQQLKMLLPKSGVLTYDSTFNSEISTYNYKASIVAIKPIEFFNFIERLNKEKHSINLAYPLSFVKLEDGEIEIEFILQFHQNL